MGAADPARRGGARKAVPARADDDFAWLLDRLAEAAPVQDPALRRRLLDRVQRSAAAGRAMFTCRHRDSTPRQPEPGVWLHPLYDAKGKACRPGEPQRTRLLRLQAGARWSAPDPSPASQRDWLVMQGAVGMGGLRLEAQDFHLQSAGAPCPPVFSDRGAWLLLREADIPGGPGPHALTQRARGAEWADYGPGIRRRVLWQHAGQAAMLYQTVAGAAVPQHAHGHDEECLMLQGDLFLDDILLRALDYQLAPAGTRHQGVSTDTGVLLYAHGDLDLDLLPA